MQPLQWVAWGLLVVVVDLAVDGWDLSADPIGWLAVITGLGSLRQVVSLGLRALAVVALVVAVATYPPDWLVLSPPLAWAASLPQGAVTAWLAFELARVLPERERTHRLLGWTLVVVALAPPVVLVTESTTLVLLLAGLAVVATVWLVVVLFRAAGDPALRSG